MNKIVLNITRWGCCLQCLRVSGLRWEGQRWDSEAGKSHQGEDVTVGETELAPSMGMVGLWRCPCSPTWTQTSGHHPGQPVNIYIDSAQLVEVLMPCTCCHKPPHSLVRLPGCSPSHWSGNPPFQQLLELFGLKLPLLVGEFISCPGKNFQSDWRLQLLFCVMI